VKAKLHDAGVNLAAMQSQRDDWEKGYYRELSRRKDLEARLTDTTLDLMDAKALDVTRVIVVTFWRKFEPCWQIVMPADTPQEKIREYARKNAWNFTIDAPANYFKSF
jgi:hypothetical protein